jgi:hypothetical protein
MLGLEVVRQLRERKIRPLSLYRRCVAEAKVTRLAHKPINVPDGSHFFVV